MNHLMLTDSSKRTISYLRVSVTDRCNYLCSYCAPSTGWPTSSKDELLTFEEILEVIRVMAWRGVKRVRFTGGEPLLRKGLPQLIAQVNELSDIAELAITTNGHLLDRFAHELNQSGIRRLNVSLDTFNPDSFARVTRGGDLKRVLKGIERVQEVGIASIQLNAVLTPELPQTPHEWINFAQEAWQRNLTPRWIEMMPIGGIHATPIQATNVLTGLRTIFNLEPVVDHEPLKRGPAQYYQVMDGVFRGARLGLISPMSDPHFCSLCNRARLTARGGLRACLANDDEVDLKSALRMGMRGPALHPFIDEALSGKRPEHLMNRGAPPLSIMTALGG